MGSHFTDLTDIEKTIKPESFSEHSGKHLMATTIWTELFANTYFRITLRVNPITATEALVDVVVLYVWLNK